jgi:hypothetical protein
MISIIVCSRNEVLAGFLKLNIESTIGVPYEIILCDNSVLQEGICKVYNKAASRAVFPLLCFVHEDVFFRTVGWGEKLAVHFNDENTGVIGVAGGDSMSLVPSSWSNTFFSKSTHIIQHIQPGADPVHIRLPANEIVFRKQVLTVDGVFMCVRKSVYEKFPFDDSLLKGFHGYDIDYSFQLSMHFRNYVVFDILLEHYSQGRQNRDWFESTVLVASKWKKQLPASIFNLSGNQWRSYHWQSLHVMINRMYELKYHPVRIYLYSLSFSVNKYLSTRKFLSMNRLFFQLLFKPRKNIQL